jgi:PAS domain S-box-containing protein
MASDGLSEGSAAAHLAGLLDSAMDGIVTADASQRVILYNRAAERIFGWSAEEMLGQPLERLVPPRLRAAHAQHMRRFAATGASSRRMGGTTVVYGLRRNGEEFPVDASISQLDTPQGRLYTVTVRDVTDRERTRRDLAAFAAEVASAREQEKARIARELHDELAQSLTAMKMDVSWARQNLDRREEVAARLAGALEMIDAAVGATRRIAADLRPPVLDDLGLVAAVEWLVHNFEERQHVACLLDLDRDLDLQEPHATALFRMLQEALANVAKHAHPAHVEVHLRREREGVCLSVQDDGAGFSPSDPRKPASLGLVGLRERAQLLRGTLTIVSAPGQGTRVEAHVPVRAAPA